MNRLQRFDTSACSQERGRTEPERAVESAAAVEATDNELIEEYCQFKQVF